MCVGNVKGNRVKAAQTERMRNGAKSAEEVGRMRGGPQLEGGGFNMGSQIVLFLCKLVHFASACVCVSETMCILCVCVYIMCVRVCEVVRSCAFHLQFGQRVWSF